MIVRPRCGYNIMSIFSVFKMQHNFQTMEMRMETSAMLDRGLGEFAF